MHTLDFRKDKRAVNTKKMYRGGTANLKFGRKSSVVRKEVEGFLTTHNLDFLVVQEAKDYFNVLHGIPNYNLYTNETDRGGNQVGIIVKQSIPVTGKTFGMVGDGWRTITGGKHAPVSFPRITLGGWLRVGGIHLPTPSIWKNGRYEAPDERKDDYLAMFRLMLRFLLIPWRSRILVGDFNEPPTTVGTWSPRNLARRAKAIIAWPDSRQGHGWIDFAVGVRCAFTNMNKHVNFPEASDHEWITFEVWGY